MHLDLINNVRDILKKVFNLDPLGFYLLLGIVVQNIIKILR